MAPWPVRSSIEQYRGAKWAVTTDTIDLAGHVVVRDVVRHPGAVGIVALDDDDRVLLIRQYRHPVGGYLFEPPAGLLDVDGEPPLTTAKRELLEEAGYQAETWHVLVDQFTTPGGSDEAIRIYLARDLVAAVDGRPRTGEAEEEHLPRAWVPLDDAVRLVLQGQLHNPTAVAGILAAAAARHAGWAGLRPADAEWLRAVARPPR
ncbi:MAG: NUDIX hydrolase [Actinomycetota bacterium]|nr:MAG: NUDIX hydrolase [Actinomycetota bacterium]